MGLQLQTGVVTRLPWQSRVSRNRRADGWTETVIYRMHT
nr:hypothetical protein JVH1_4147 [Rhodococcus sp. JVH1]